MADSTRVPGLLTQLGGPGANPFPQEELRLATVLNGGVSLAVWMGGVTHEINRLVKALDPNGNQVYAQMLRLSGCTARVDIISGTSAGGINGAALGLAQAYPTANLAILRDVWIDQGDIDKLLRRPFQGSPTSLLRGDDYFLPQLNAVLHRLAGPAGQPSAAPLHLSITTTVLRGNESLTVDSMAQELPQTLHAGRFVWKRDGDATNPAADPFSKANIRATVDQLALAARSTASFPVAFEPVFVPVGVPSTEPLRPDMAGVAQDWGDAPRGGNQSRYVVDGGLLANTPTRPALQSIFDMPATEPVRRVMLLVYPHAGAPTSPTADDLAHPPTLSRTVFGLLDALSSTGNRTFVEEIERHNRIAAGRRGTRADLLQDLVRHSGDDAPPEALRKLATCIHPRYRSVQRARDARDLASRLVDRDRTSATKRLAGQWNYERIRYAVLEAAARDAEHQAERQPLPTAPGPDGPRVWPLGTDLAEAVVDAVADVLRRLAFVTPTSSTELTAARGAIIGLARDVRAAREGIDKAWDAQPDLARLEPASGYWRLWLGLEELRMATDPQDLAAVQRARADLRERVKELRDDPGGAHDDAGPARPAPDWNALNSWVEAQSPGDVGARIHETVHRAVGLLHAALPTLAHEQSDRSAVLDADLAGWRGLLTRDGIPSQEELLNRLVLLAMVHSVVGDELATENTQPVELVQLSAHTVNPLSVFSLTADDKLGGWSAHRFGGFLKRSWRVNDWVWGRIDAATMLSRTVLHPRHVRRAAVLSGYLSPEVSGSDPQARAEATLADLLKHLPDGIADHPRLAEHRTAVLAELRTVLDPTVPMGELPASLPHLANLFAAALQLHIVPEELPALRCAIGADRVAGANPRSMGERFLVEHADLFAAAAADQLGTATQRFAAYQAFDRAGIGREPWPEELSSDLMLRVATTAAAVGVTVVDSPRAGLGALRTVTRTLRGVALVPYWGIQALTSRSQLARTLTLLAFSIGGVLLALSLLGVLPAALAGAGTALGLGAVLAAVGFGALRTGTLLHSIVLLTPLFALTGYAATQIDAAARSERGALASALTSLGVVLAIAVGLMVLGSLPSPSGSVAAALDRLARRFETPSAAGEQPPPRSKPGRLAWWARGVLTLVRRATPAILLVTGVLALGVAASARSVDVRTGLSQLQSWWYAAVVAMIALVGAYAATVQGNSLKVLRNSPDGRTWTYGETHPAGAAAGWAVLYGVAYLGLAAVLARASVGLPQQPWVASLLVGVLVLGASLALVASSLLPRQAVKRLRAREIGDARRNPDTIAPQDDPGAEASYIEHLVSRGIALQRWVRVSGTSPVLTSAGRDLLAAARAAAGGGARTPVGGGVGTPAGAGDPQEPGVPGAVGDTPVTSGRADRPGRSKRAGAAPR